MVKPILFNTEMVRAILDGRKTVTRRLVKKDGWSILNIPPWGKNTPNGFGDVWFEGSNGDELAIIPIRSPYRPGDILYVRETWRLIDFDFIDTDWTASVQYKADMAIGERWHDLSPDERTGWRPSIHMPREAARTFLRVTDVRVERLQEIGEDGIRAEGLTSACVHVGDMEIAAQEFALLWNSTIKPADRDRYGWAANPWVWVIEFERCDNPEIF